jgi:hypothetical protein
MKQGSRGLIDIGGGPMLVQRLARNATVRRLRAATRLKRAIPASCIVILRRSPPELAAAAVLGMAAAALLIAASTACAQVGNRNFFSPLVVQDPNPSNQFQLVPQYLNIAHGQVWALPFQLEKQLRSDFSVQFSNNWSNPSCDHGFACDGIAPQRRGRVRSRHRRSRVVTDEEVLSGFTDLEILTKYAFFTSDEHETRLAFGSDLYLPTGDKTAGGNTHTYLGPILMFAKGFGDLPNHGMVKYLRPLALQGDVEYLFKTGGTRSWNSL